MIKVKCGLEADPGPYPRGKSRNQKFHLQVVTLIFFT